MVIVGLVSRDDCAYGKHVMKKFANEAFVFVVFPDAYFVSGPVDEVKCFFCPVVAVLDVLL